MNLTLSRFNVWWDQLWKRSDWDGLGIVDGRGLRDQLWRWSDWSQIYIHIYIKIFPIISSLKENYAHILNNNSFRHFTASHFQSSWTSYIGWLQPNPPQLPHFWQENVWQTPSIPPKKNLKRTKIRQEKSSPGSKSINGHWILHHVIIIKWIKILDPKHFFWWKGGTNGSRIKKSILGGFFSAWMLLC